jgi:hypothetical protein
MESLVNPVEYLPTLELDPRGGKTVVSVRHLLNHLPDLQLFKHPHRSGTVSFASTKAINGLEKSEFFTRNTEAGQVLEVWIYSLVEGHQVYNIPLFYELGRSVDGGFGFTMSADTDERLEGAGCRYKLRKSIKEYQASKTAIPY